MNLIGYRNRQLSSGLLEAALELCEKRFGFADGILDASNRPRHIFDEALYNAFSAKQRKDLVTSRVSDDPTGIFAEQAWTGEV